MLTTNGVGTDRRLGGEGRVPGRLRLSTSGGRTASSMGQVDDIAERGLGMDDMDPVRAGDEGRKEDV